jgi:hypothetical protein
MGEVLTRQDDRGWWVVAGYPPHKIYLLKTRFIFKYVLTDTTMFGMIGTTNKARPVAPAKEKQDD